MTDILLEFMNFFEGLAYTIKITEKYDVYSFGVLVLEVIKGKHPRDQMFFLQFQLHLPIPLDEMLDPRLPPDPLFDVAFSCLNGNPESRLIITLTDGLKRLASFLLKKK
ncbi:hypothetical protein CISIN_1g041728mg [Citrus sinensis]|uniref:non-specific serine/threonine protein kinase n=1 Tax=Citrus sinensis TaxID=2711 RepID=A0A067DJ58_CITSI|nr:hypothetical protein CISIN_1g041728mg [Citrus sinensis]